MKLPAPPPDPSVVWEQLTDNPKRLVEVLTVGRPETGEYLPWDKIRYKTPPGDLSHEEWWLSLRMARKTIERTLPLFDVEGHPFTFALPDEVLKLTDLISRRASGMIATPESVTNPATRDRYVVSSLMEEAITSSQLEGASTSRRDAKQLIRSGRSPRNRSERMILNNYRAMRSVGRIKDEPFTPERVCELRSIVTEGTLDDPDSAGQIQTNPDPSDRVAVYDDEDNVLHRPPPVGELPCRLQGLCEFANASGSNDRWMPPVLRAITIHFMMGYDHYFEDGNGRTARACFYWSMLKQGFWLTEYLTISKILKEAPSKYVRSFLLSEQDQGDLTYFFLYHLKVINRALDDLDRYLARKASELREIRLLLSTTPGEYNHRQLAVLELAIKDPSSSYTALSHAESHNVSNETARSDLLDLEVRGLLKRGKVRRQFVWTPAPNLARVLQPPPLPL